MAKLSNLTFLKDIIRSNKSKWGIIVLINILTNISALILPYLSKLQIDQLQRQNTFTFQNIYLSPINLFIVIIAIVSLINLLSTWFGQIKNRITSKFNFQIGIHLEELLMKKMENFDVSFLNNPKNRSITETIYTSSYILNNIIYLAESLIRTFVYIGILPIAYYSDKTIFYIILISGFAEIIINYFWYNYSQKVNTVISIQSNNTQQLRWTLLSQLHNIVPMNAQEKIFGRIIKDKQKIFDVRQKITKKQDHMSLLIHLLEATPSVLINIILAIKVFNGQATLGDFTMFTMYATQLSGIFSNITNLIGGLQDIVLNISRINFFFNLKSRIRTPNKPTSIQIKGEIQFHDLFFSYPQFDEEEREYLKKIIKFNKKSLEKIKGYSYEEKQLKKWQELLEEHEKPSKTILDKLNLTLKKGTITAMIGRNGAGKTTTANLILKGYSPIDGEIIIDGINIDEFSSGNLRDQVSMITQIPVILSGLSLKENLTLSVNRHVSDEEIMKLAETLDIKEAIESLPKKLDTIIGEEGNLSGGQVQLAAILRVILQDRPIIIFDEGTNQLDAEHENKIITILKNMKKNKTILIITHKMTTARHADNIVVMDNGKIVEQGTHEDLLKTESLYKTFWDMQVVN